jgi:hypothetical protein
VEVLAELGIGLLLLGGELHYGRRRRRSSSSWVAFVRAVGKPHWHPYVRAFGQLLVRDHDTAGAARWDVNQRQWEADASIVARDWHLIPTARIKAKSEAHALIAGISKNFDEARRYAELTQFEFEQSPDWDRTALRNLESTLSRAGTCSLP